MRPKPIVPWKIASSLESSLDSKLRDFFESYSRAVDEAELQAALEGGNYSAAEAELGLGSDGWAIAALVALIMLSLRRTVDVAGGLAAEQLGVPYSVNWANSWLEREAIEVGRDINGRASETMSGIILRGIASGLSFREIARQLRFQIWLLDRNAGAVAAQQARMAEEGMKAGQVAEAQAKAVHRGLLARATMLAATLTTAAIFAAFRAVWSWFVSTGRPSGTVEEQWLTEHDELVCDRCAPLHGVTQPYGSTWGPHGAEGPPLHPLCRCQVILLIDGRTP